MIYDLIKLLGWHENELKRYIKKVQNLIESKGSVQPH